MPIFKVSLKLFYERSGHLDDEEIDFAGVPDLKEEDLSNFILTNGIQDVFIEELSFDNVFGVLTDAEFNEQTKELSFKLTIDEDTLFIEMIDDMEDMVKQIKDNLFDYSLEDSLYEGLRAAYTVADARHYYNDQVQFQNNNHPEDHLEVGLIDYRNQQTILVEHIIE